MKPLTALLWVLALAGLILLFWGGPDYYSARSYKAAWGLGHIVLFAIWCYLLIQHWPRLREMAFHHQSMWLLGAALLIGTLTEIIQTFFGRTLLLRDLIRDETFAQPAKNCHFYSSYHRNSRAKFHYSTF